MKNVSPVLGIGSSVQVGDEFGTVTAIKGRAIHNDQGDRHVYPVVVITVNGNSHELPGKTFESLVSNP